jgi:hypothetical protein
MLNSAPEALAEAEQAILAAQIDSAISSAFSSLVDEHTDLVQEPSQGSDGLTLLSHVSYDTLAVLTEYSMWQDPPAHHSCCSTTHASTYTARPQLCAQQVLNSQRAVSEAGVCPQITTGSPSS